MSNLNKREMDLAMGLDAAQEPVDVSVILPAYNEADSVEGACRQIAEVLDCQDFAYEILFVDDGSTDGTWAELEKLANKYRRVRALRHRRNCGKASALANGFTYARGEIMVTTDADMQYDPKDIVRLIDKVREGFDVVSAYKVVRRDKLERRLASKFFNFFVRNTTGVQLHDFNAGLKAYHYAAAEDLVRYGYGELHRFFILLAARNGYSVAEVPVESCPRPNGQSKYGLERYMRGALDYLTVFFLAGYTERPLHLLGSAGLWLGGIGSAIFGYLAYLAIVTGRSIGDRPLLDIAVLLLLSGVQLIVVGLIAEMINNLDRGSSNSAKISRVIRVDRRTSIMLAPGVMVERRGTMRAVDVVDAMLTGPDKDRDATLDAG
jgi:glycosyltransferase involved in cell wall biosynthesis